MSISPAAAERFAQKNLDPTSPKTFQNVVKFYHNAQKERMTTLLENVFTDDPMELIALLHSIDDLIWC
jgi:hypothetical protein